MSGRSIAFDEQVREIEDPRKRRRPRELQLLFGTERQKGAKLAERGRRSRSGRVRVGAIARESGLCQVDVEDRHVSGLVPSARDLEYFARDRLRAQGQRHSLLSLIGPEICRRDASERLAQRVLGLCRRRGELGAGDSDSGRSASAQIEILEDADLDLLGTVAAAGGRLDLGVFPEEKRRRTETRARFFDARPGGQDGRGPIAREREGAFQRQRLLGGADGRQGSARDTASASREEVRISLLIWSRGSSRSLVSGDRNENGTRRARAWGCEGCRREGRPKGYSLPQESQSKGRRARRSRDPFPRNSKRRWDSTRSRSRGRAVAEGLIRRRGADVGQAEDRRREGGEQKQREEGQAPASHAGAYNTRSKETFLDIESPDFRPTGKKKESGAIA